MNYDCDKDKDIEISYVLVDLHSVAALMVLLMWVFSQ